MKVGETCLYQPVDVLSKMYMAGTLWKWTNYFSGWQARWFVLDKGILSYYKTQDDVNTGCKGSVKLSVCDITVHGTDNTRLDLIIPGEQYFYLKASSAQERQQWLVALGSTKASMGKIIEETENTKQNLLKTKKSELRLYCDLLMQQIHSVKVCVSDGEKPDIERLDQSSSLISPTCDTFIQTLEECMQLVQSAILTFEGQQSLITDAALPSSPSKISSRKGSHLTRQNSHDGISPHSFSRSLSGSINETSSSGDQKFHKHRLSDAAISDQSKKELVSNPMIKTNVQKCNYGPSQDIVQSNMLDLSSLSSNISDTKMDITDGVDVNNSSNCSQTSELIKLKQLVAGSNSDMSCNGHQTSDDNSGEDVFLDPYEFKVPTFFSVMKTSFMNLTLTIDGGIPVEPFLESCKNLLPIFDKLNSTAFAPVKMDFQGNIRKVQTKYSVNPKEFTTVQNIILHEMSTGQQYLPSSATMALLWMKRSLEFIASFLMEIKLGEENLGTAASNAYTKSLKPFHGWVVRGVFAVAVKALPYRRTFVSLLNPGNKDIDHETFQTSLLQDLDAFCHAIIAVVKLLDDFFTAHSLNVHEQV